MDRESTGTLRATVGGPEPGAEPEATVDLTVVIVNWNVRDLLRQCLRSLLDGGGLLVIRDSEAGARIPSPDSPEPEPPTPGRFPRTEIIVVDNASRDGSAEMVRAEFPEVRLIANEENRGFAAANNQGLAAARGRTLMLLNPDTELVGDALATMVRTMDSQPRVGVLGPQLRYPDGSVQSSRRRFPSLLTAFVESTVVQEWRPDSRILRHYYMDDRPPPAAGEGVQEVDWLVGACLLVRREAYEQAGGLDEGYFMYSEEMDWCRQIQEAGWAVAYEPAATVIHHEGKSSEQVVAARHIRFQSSKVRYFRKHHGAGQGELVRWFLLATYVYQWGREGLKWLVGHRRPLRVARMRAYGQVLRSGLR